MKSVNPNAKNPNKLVSRLGVLSYMGLMVLTLATGGNALAADFKLWQQVKVSEKPLEVQRLDKFEKGVEKSEKWLITEPDFKKFATSFSAEPFQFAEGLKAGLLKSFKDGSQDAFRAAAKEGFEKLEAKDFGGFIRQSALKTIIEKILAMDKTKLEDEKFLEELFADPAVRAALGLTDKDPNEKPVKEEPKGEKPVIKEEPKGDKPDTSAKDAENAKKLAEEVARNAQLQAAIQAMQAQAQQQNLGTGELNDGALDNLKAQVCGGVDALKAQLDANRSSLDAQLSGVNELFNRFASASRVGDVARNENKDRLEDILPGLLQNALGQQQQTSQIAPPPPPPTIPPQAQNEGRQNDNSIFDQPLPSRPQQQEEQPLAPLQLPQPQSSGVQQAITLDLPTATGTQELRDAQEQITKLEGRTPIAATLGQNAGLTDLVMGKARVQSDLRMAQSALQNVKDRAAKLDEALETELKEGGRAALPPWVAKKEAELQAKLDKANKAIQSIQQGAQFAKDQASQSAVQGQFQAASNQASTAEEELNKFKADVQTKVTEGNKKIKALAKRRDDLQSTASKLEGQLGGLKEEEQAMQALISNNMQMQLAAIQGGGQGAVGTPNVNKISQGVGRGGAPRSVVPGRLGATGTNLQTGSSVPAAGTQRGPLSGGK